MRLADLVFGPLAYKGSDLRFELRLRSATRDACDVVGPTAIIASLNYGRTRKGSMRMLKESPTTRWRPAYLEFGCLCRCEILGIRLGLPFCIPILVNELIDGVAKLGKERALSTRASPLV